MRSGPRTLARQSDAFVEKWIGKAPSGWRALLPPEAAGKGLDGCPALFVREAGRLFPSAGQTVGADDAVRPSVRFHRTTVACGDTAAVPSATHFFCLARKSGQKEALEADRIVPQATEYPVEERCGQHTMTLCKAELQRRLRGDNAPIDSSFHAGRWQNTLPWKWQAIYVCADGATIFAFYCKCL